MSYKLVQACGQITVEDLNIKGLVKNHKLAQAISEVGWGTFVSFLDYKGAWYGCWVHKADRFFASSKTCHVCGLKNSSLALSHREWTCRGCVSVLDRDGNAAINLEFYPHLAGDLNGTAGRKNAGGDSEILDVANYVESQSVKPEAQAL